MSKTYWRTRGAALAKRLVAILLASAIWIIAWKCIMPQDWRGAVSPDQTLRIAAAWFVIWIGVGVYNWLRGNQKFL